MKKFTRLVLLLLINIAFLPVAGQNILPSPMKAEKLPSSYTIKNELKIVAPQNGISTAEYVKERLGKYLNIKMVKSGSGDINLQLDKSPGNLGKDGYLLEVNKRNITITANTNTGLFYGIQSLLQLLPEQVQAGESYRLVGFEIPGIKVTDKPKYAWRSFMLDSGRQYQTPDFIKRYLDYLAMLKMNVFHWHLTEGQGWRIEIKKYPRLTEIGSRVANGEQQQGFYSQEEIRDIVAYAKKLHITIVPEIDVPGHSEAALSAYPEYTCFNKAPESVMGFSKNLFCAGKEKTYTFLENVLDEVCDLFPSEYIHLGGDEAPKGNWDNCPDCQGMIQKEGLADAHELQLYFSSRLANYLKTKGRKVIFWGDVIYHDGYKLPDNVVIQWWNWRGHKDLAYKNAIKNGYPVICNTNYYTYLNFPVTPWSKYAANRTFDLRMAYEENPSDIAHPNSLVKGMDCALWTDWHVLQNRIDSRVFPRIYALAEEMWNSGERLPFDDFYEKVKLKYPLLHDLGIDYGPAMKGDNTKKD